MNLFWGFAIGVLAFFVGIYREKRKNFYFHDDITIKGIEEIAKKAFEAWIAALKTGDPNAVAKLYHDKATFHPTKSPHLKEGKEGAVEYFLHFLKKNPICKVISEKIRVLAPYCFLYTGFYRFTLGKEEVLEGRFSFILVKNRKGEWEFFHHHSSEKPCE